eukprot:TRINITY_DN49733_c0_g1_i1.p1 TRINITY_DN49733_c0_g1~~TRINITY_DN49733_c0_g1_i1.p1  ORF type:complete len:216 (-),score=52.60 TRINITY_DN49733_c0_g1_i1:272-919(-)
MCVMMDKLHVFTPGVLWDLGVVLPDCEPEERYWSEPRQLSTDRILADVTCTCAGPDSSHIIGCSSDGVLPSSGKLFQIQLDGRVDVIGEDWGNTKCLVDLGKNARHLMMPRSNFLESFYVKVELSEADIDQIWRKYDRDDNHRISDDEAESFLRDLSQATGHEYDDDQLKMVAQRVVEAMDSDGNGFIEMQEFKRFFHGQSLVSSVAAVSNEPSE